MMQKQLAAIVIPVYKAELSLTETVALRQLRKVLGAYPIYFIHPESLPVDYGELGEGIDTEAFDEVYFQSVRGYSVLMLSAEFYDRFAGFEYVLIYQLDAFVFSDRLAEFCQMGYDYIGAPVRRLTPLWHAIGARVGNGGFSLRRVASCRKMIPVWEKLWTDNHPWREELLECEDAFWGYCGKNQALDFSVPDVKTALEFAVQENIQHTYPRMLAGWRPFGAHGWNKMDAVFWERILAREGYPLKGLVSNDFGRRDIVRKWQVHQQANLPRVYGCWQRKDFRGALDLMLDYLQQYDEGHKTWQQQTYDLFQLWHMAEGDRGQAGIISDLFQQTVEEGIRRTITSGNFTSLQLWWGDRLAKRLAAQVKHRDGTALREMLLLGHEAERRAGL